MTVENKKLKNTLQILKDKFKENMKKKNDELEEMIDLFNESIKKQKDEIYESTIKQNFVLE
jgi:hypothetical protein